MSLIPYSLTRPFLFGMDAEAAHELIMDMRRVLEPSLLLVGLYNPANNLGVEAGFAASRFRALDELKKENVEEQEALV